MECKKKLASLLKQNYPKNVYIHIFSILKNNKHSSNVNGIFFNLSDVAEEDMIKCIEYLECIEYNAEEHFKHLNIREDIENQYKMDLATSTKQVKPKTVQKRVIKEEEYSTDDKLVQKKTYKGVYKRLDRVIRGLKPEEIKIKKKKSQEVEEEEEPYEDEIAEEDDDLFGEEEEIEEPEED
jgi:hypothetical protein